MIKNIFNILGKKELKNASWLIGGRILQMVLSLFVGIVIARYLGPENYGLLSYGGAYVSFFTAFCNLGINSIIIKEFVDYPNEQGKAIGSALIMRLISSVLSALLIIAIVSVLDKDEPITIIVVALCSIGSIFHIFEIFNYWFQSIYKSKVTSIAILLSYILTSIYKIVLLYLGKDVIWFALATSIDYIVVAIFLWIAYKKNNGPALSFSITKSKSLLLSSYHYILSSIMVAVYMQTDKFMLKQMLNASEVGYYAIAATICNMWVFVLQAIIDSIYPTIIRLKNIDYLEYEKKNKQLYAVVFYVSCVVSIGFILLGEWIVELLYGTSFLPAASVLKIICWYTAFSFLGVARNAWIVSEGKQRFLKYMYGGAAIINIVLNFILIPRLGAFGAAIASLVTNIFTSIVLPFCIKEMRRNSELMLQAIFLKGLK